MRLELALVLTSLMLAGGTGALAEQPAQGGLSGEQAPLLAPELVEQQLATTIAGAVDEHLGIATADERSAAVACMAGLVAPLSNAAKSELVYFHMGSTGDLMAVEAERPGLGLEIWNCIRPSILEVYDTPLGKRLELVMLMAITENMKQASLEVREATFYCMREVLARLTPDEMQMLIDTRVKPSREQAAELEAAHPGVTAAGKTCT